MPFKNAGSTTTTIPVIPVIEPVPDPHLFDELEPPQTWAKAAVVVGLANLSGLAYLIYLVMHLHP